MNDPHALLWWLPVGAGGHIVIHTSHWWELWDAARTKRAPQPLFHAALEVFTTQTRHVIEMAPAWGQADAARQVVATGPVGVRPLGRWALFRYEVRCWDGGDIPDRGYAVDKPVRIPLAAGDAESMVARIAAVSATVEK